MAAKSLRGSHAFRSRLFIGFLFFLFSLSARAQDTLKYLDGTSEIVRIQEINMSSIKYTRADKPGPIYSVQISKIHMISYKNGSQDVFNNKVPTYSPGVNAPANNSGDFTPPPTLKFSGPRLGCTVVGEGTAADYIIDKGKTPVVSQFGWQLETRIFTTPKGTAGLAELVMLIGGLEQGMFLPSASFMFGIRAKNGLEFAVGPNLSLSGLGMAFAVGGSFRSGDIYFPVNLAFVPSVKSSETVVSYTGKKTTTYKETGYRVSLLIGFNTRKR